LKSKLTFCLFALGLLALVICLAACGRTTTSGDGVIAIPHATDWGFSNCLVCHSDGDVAVPDNHAAYTTDQCSMCHLPASTQQTKITTPPAGTTTPPAGTTTPPAGTTTPPAGTTTPPAGTTTPPAGPGAISASNHATQSNASMCNICHTGASAILANPANHADYADDSCLDAGCHELP